MAGFSQLTEDEYSNLNFANTPPPYKAAMDLASKFGSFSLDGDALSCNACGKGVRGRCLSMDDATDDPAEMKDCDDDDDDDDEETAVRRRKMIESAMDADPRTNKFTYEGKGYCNLECFFVAHREKPGLCMYVDRLATVLFEYNRARRDSEEEYSRK
jgi:hypothetical protein